MPNSLPHPLLQPTQHHPPLVFQSTTLSLLFSCSALPIIFYPLTACHSAPHISICLVPWTFTLIPHHHNFFLPFSSSNQSLSSFYLKCEYSCNSSTASNLFHSGPFSHTFTQFLLPWTHSSRLNTVFSQLDSTSRKHNPLNLDIER